ncbi:MAG TPA: hypothetical protein VMY88_01940, partial [Acidimicrobiales bacterium]|nr:hypothetical protein [Acidimicrobiales bacterium]
MRLLLPLAAALGGGAFAVLLAGALPQAARRRRGAAVQAPIVIAALTGLLTHAASTGNLGIDLVLGGGVAALAAWAGARASHRFLAVYAVVVTVLLSLSAVVAAGAGVAIAVVLLRSRMPPLKAIAGGLLGVGLLTEIGRRGPSWRE